MHDIRHSHLNSDHTSIDNPQRWVWKLYFFDVVRPMLPHHDVSMLLAMHCISYWMQSNPATTTKNVKKEKVRDCPSQKLVAFGYWFELILLSIQQRRSPLFGSKNPRLGQCHRNDMDPSLRVHPILLMFHPDNFHQSLSFFLRFAILAVANTTTTITPGNGNVSSFFHSTFRRSSIGRKF